MQRYRAKRDWWAVGVLVASVLLAVVGLIALFASPSGGFAKAALGLVVVAGGAFALLLLVHTHYDLGGGRLRVQHGVLRWNIPVKDIRAVSRVRSFASSAALSRERLKVSYGTGHACIEIAPVDEKAFTGDLRAIAPGIEVTGV
jgi:hypothetical protein